MSKAILILDMPSCCNKCPCFDCGDDRCCCNALNKDLKDDTTIIDKDCPLKPLPSKKKVKEIKHLEDFVYVKTEYDLITNNIVGKIKYDVETIFNEGYNSCLDEILGEEQ